MAGMTDWYLVRQLQNFKNDVRGSHVSDFYGMQMGFMGRTPEGAGADIGNLQVDRLGVC